MKTVNYLLMVSAAFLVVACTESIDTISIPEKEITLTATRENLDPGTKSFRLDDGSVWWSPKEEVSVFYGSGTNGGSKFSTMNTSIAETVELQGSVQMSGSAKDFWAVYPYSEDNSCDGTSVTTIIPSDQVGVEGNFSNDVFPAVAKSSTMNLAFWNICGGVKFFVSRSDIKYVTFKGNNDEPLAGKVKVTFGPDGTPVVTEVVDPRTEVKLTAPEGGTFKVGKYYYITLLPTGLQGGFTMSFRTENEKGTLVSTTPQIIKRSTFGVLKNIDSKVQDWNSALPEPDVVDLGLSVLWSTFNLGASAPEEYGNYYAYGETEPKSEYTPGNYVRPSSPYYARKQSPRRIVVYPLENLPPEYDAASKALGGDWRMPTRDELEELVNDCVCSQTTINGITGSTFTSKINGNCIFLPNAGFKATSDRIEISDLDSAGLEGFYWSSSKTYGPFWLRVDNDAYVSSDSHWLSAFYSDISFVGQSVRPVKPNPNPRHVESVSLDKNEVTLYEGREVTLDVTVMPETAANRDVEWSSSAPDVAAVIGTDTYVLEDERIYAVVKALSPGTATLTVSTVDGQLQASCRFTVLPKQEIEAVDLGLSVKWASQNLGAYGPEEYDEYYMWSRDHNYYHPGDNTELTAKDIVREELGDKWRMPTISELQELVDNCTWSWTTLHGVSGTTVTSRINGKSIFLPAAGMHRRYSDVDMLIYCGHKGYYWSSSLNPGSRGWGRYLLFDANGESFGNADTNNQDDMQSIRPVYGEFIPVESISLDNSSLKLHPAGTYQLTATISPSNASAKYVNWISSDKSVAAVNENGLVTALAEGSTTITAYASSGLSASCEVTVKKVETIPNGYEYVDLGLPSGLKWATMNVGATKPEEYGDYFAWGETEPKSNYSWSTYKWCNGSSNTQTKYNTSSSYGTVDNKTVLDPEDDAAHVNWGGSWRMPTKEERDELRNKCTWTWTTQNGVNGRLVTGPNGKSIFLPAAGYRNDTSLDDAGSWGDYWSSSLNTGRPDDAYDVHFNSNNVRWYSYYRYFGSSVRPVSE